MSNDSKIDTVAFAADYQAALAKLDAEYQGTTSVDLAREMAQAGIPASKLGIGLATTTVMGSMFIKAALTPAAVTGFAASGPILGVGLLAAGATALTFSIFKAPGAYKEIGKRTATSIINNAHNVGSKAVSLVSRKDKTDK